MSEKLDIFEDYRNSGYYLAWVIDGDQGAEIATKPPSDDAEAKAIVEAVRPFARQQGKGYSVFVFDSKASATQALRAARAAVKLTKAATPWPDWAITAAAHGWAAPKTWKP